MYTERLAAFKDWRFYAVGAVFAGAVAYAAHNDQQRYDACKPIRDQFNATAAAEGVNAALKQVGAEAKDISIHLGKNQGLICPQTLNLHP